MATLKERLFTVLQDPRVAKLMRNPNVQKVAIKAFRFRGHVEGAVDHRIQRIAGMLNLATQRDLRSLQRRIRHLDVGTAGSGRQRVEWDGRDDTGREVPSGMYLYEVRMGGERSQRAMVLLR